jgi:hypothetical protein
MWPKILSICVGLVVVTPDYAHADWLAKAFAGVSLAATHGFVDLDQAADQAKVRAGGGVSWEHDALVMEFEVASSPTFFKNTGDLIQVGNLTTLVGNVTWLFGARERTFRVYATGGAGVIRVRLEDALDAFSTQSSLGAANVGGGIVMRLAPRLRWYAEAKYFRSQFAQQNAAGLGEEFVAFPRISSGVLLRLY